MRQSISREKTKEDLEGHWRPSHLKEGSNGERLESAIPFSGGIFFDFSTNFEIYSVLWRRVIRVNTVWPRKHRGPL